MRFSFSFFHSRCLQSPNSYIELVQQALRGIKTGSIFYIPQFDASVRGALESVGFLEVDLMVPSLSL